MRDDADFAAYLAARWPFLVRSLVLLGGSTGEAEEVARSGLARCYASWGRVVRADDVDAHVYGVVLDRWHRHLRRQGRAGSPAGEPAEVREHVARPGTDELPDAVRLRVALEEQLDGLTREHREVLVLRFAAGLTVPQVAEVLDVTAGTARARLTDALGHLDLSTLREVAG